VLIFAIFLNVFSGMMRQIFTHQLSLDHVPIEDIQLDLNSRDPLVAFLFGIQSILTNNAACKKLTTLLKTHNPKVSNIVVAGYECLGCGLIDSPQTGVE